jgi:hypothetical protein
MDQVLIKKMWTCKTLFQDKKGGSDKIWGIKCGVGRKDMVKKPLIFDGFIYLNYLFSLQNTIHFFF